MQASKATSFNAAMAEMAVKSRSKQVQRVVNLILTSLEGDALHARCIIQHESGIL